MLTTYIRSSINIGTDMSKHCHQYMIVVVVFSLRFPMTLTLPLEPQVSSSLSLPRGITVGIASGISGGTACTDHRWDFGVGAPWASSWYVHRHFNKHCVTDLKRGFERGFGGISIGGKQITACGPFVLYEVSQFLASVYLSLDGCVDQQRVEPTPLRSLV